MLYREIIAVCSQIHTKHKSTLCGQNKECVNVKLVVRIVTTGLQRGLIMRRTTLPWQPWKYAVNICCDPSRPGHTQPTDYVCMYHTILSAKDTKRRNSVAMATETGSMLDDVTKTEHVRRRSQWQVQEVTGACGHTELRNGHEHSKWVQGRDPISKFL